LQKLLFLNRSYWPDSEATGQLLTDLCEHLAKSFDVHVVCGQPNSASDTDYLTSGIQCRNGVTIHRLKHTQFVKRVPAGRLLNLVSFTRGTQRYLKKCDLQPDIVVCETDPFMLPVVAAKYSQRIGAKLVCYLQDIYPDVAEAIGKVKPGFITNQIRSKLRTAYEQADRVIVLGSCMKERLSSAPWSIDNKKIKIIPNWADCEKIKPIPHDQNPFRKEHDLQDKFVVMHSGNMGLTQRLDVLIEASALPSWPDNAVLLLVGDGAAKEKLHQQAAALHSHSTIQPRALATGIPPTPSTLPLHASPATLHASKIHFLPYQAREKLSESLSAADIHIISMHENITGCLCPSKLYGILAAGRPVLAIADASTDLCQTVKRHDLGWCTQPGDVVAIAKNVSAAVSAAANDNRPPKQARCTALARFDQPVVLAKLSKAIAAVEPTQVSREPAFSVSSLS